MDEAEYDAIVFQANMEIQQARREGFAAGLEAAAKELMKDTTTAWESPYVVGWAKRRAARIRALAEEGEDDHNTDRPRI